MGDAFDRATIPLTVQHMQRSCSTCLHVYVLLPPDCTVSQHRNHQCCWPHKPGQLLQRLLHFWALPSANGSQA